MAIKRNVIDEQDNALTDVYSRITYINVHNKEGGDVIYHVKTWKSKTAYNNGKRPVHGLESVFSTNYDALPNNILGGLYSHLLLQDGYSTGLIIND